MSIARRWVIGRGLLGNAVARARYDEPFRIGIRWDDPRSAVSDLAAGARQFLAMPGPLEIYWCAGRGVTSTQRESLFTEVGVFDAFLGELGAFPAEVRARLTIFVASSVGGAYGGVANAPHRESGPTGAASAYGEAKLAMEESATNYARAHGWRTVLGRITNLYGPGQDLRKGQGLISTLVNSAVTGQPARIYVSLDTLRDYIFEDDAAAVISAATTRASRLAPGSSVVKIIGTGRAVSIGAIIGELRRLHRRAGFALVAQGGAAGQSRDLRVASEMWPDLDALVGISLPEGLGRVLRARFELLARG
ncbi:epimerase [Actinomycetales bacterium SN12]|nr:epimerase [Actinomycetales bacterium SN12]